jgi:hypothetical protein
MKYLKKYNESNISIWEEIEDILSPISDNLCIKTSNFRVVTGSSKSSILIKKDWEALKSIYGYGNTEEKKYFKIEDIKDELNHLCNRFPDIINQIQIFRSHAKNPDKYTTYQFLKESPNGLTFLVGITFKIEKEGAPFIPN